jgi:hypothetical protein
MQDRMAARNHRRGLLSGGVVQQVRFGPDRRHQRSAAERRRRDLNGRGMS